MSIENAMVNSRLQMSHEEVKATQEYVKSLNQALRAQQKGGTQELGKDDFLRLLVTQLRYQDPLKPMEDKEFIAQMAQFSSLEQTKNMADTLEKMNNTMTTVQERQNALNFLGKYVEVVKEDGNKEFGKVESIDPKSRMLQINGQLYSADQVGSVFAYENHAPESKQNIVEGEQSL